MACQFTPCALPEADRSSADLVDRNRLLVSQRLRDLIERFEPGVHRFTPDPTAGAAIPRYALQIQQSFDAVSAAHSTWIKQSDVLWRPSGSIDERMVFESTLIGDRHLWKNDGLGSDRPAWASDALIRAALDAGMTGLLIERHDETDAAGGYLAPARSSQRVYQLSCPPPMRPNNPHVPLTITAKALDGDLAKIEFADPTAAPPTGRPSLSRGFAVMPTHLPTHIQYQQNAKGGPNELFGSSAVPLSVTGTFRDVVESVEPDTHQFVPVRFVDKQGGLIEQRFFFVVCQQIDSVSREHSQMLFDRLWYNPGNEYSKIVYDRAAIGDRHIWRDARISGTPILYSARLAEAVHAAGLPSIHYAHWEMR